MTPASQAADPPRTRRTPAGNAADTPRRTCMRPAPAPRPRYPRPARAVQGQGGHGHGAGHRLGRVLPGLHAVRHLQRAARPARHAVRHRPGLRRRRRAEPGAGAHHRRAHDPHRRPAAGLRPLLAGAGHPGRPGRARAGRMWLLLHTNLLTVSLALLTAFTYVAIYTPLKRVTTLATFIGAFPGAMGPLLGWTAARGASSGPPWPSSPSCSSGSFLTSWPSPGSIATTTPAPASACCPWCSPTDGPPWSKPCSMPS